jgi:hypothetical protein
MVQQCVINALAVGSTLTGAAEAYGVCRVTVYRWIKTHKVFSAPSVLLRTAMCAESQVPPPPQMYPDATGCNMICRIARTLHPRPAIRLPRGILRPFPQDATRCNTI